MVAIIYILCQINCTKSKYDSYDSWVLTICSTHEFWDRDFLLRVSLLALLDPTHMFNTTLNARIRQRNFASSAYPSLSHSFVCLDRKTRSLTDFVTDPSRSCVPRNNQVRQSVVSGGVNLTLNVLKLY